jgi:virulence factor Mce-like protein
MEKQAPSLARLTVMVTFALSCFGLLVFLWSAFGGPLPLRAKGYQVKVAFDEASSLGVNGDVRISGVKVGKVTAKELDPRTSRTVATIELSDRYVPLASDARAILRQKTLLGETYVELTRGSPGARPLAEDERLPDGRVDSTVQLDEILSALDEPTRDAFRTWQRDFGRAVAGRGDELNDALGTLPVLLDPAERLLTVLDRNERAVRATSRNTGVVFEALTADERRLRGLVSDGAAVFGETARRRERLAETIRVLPTFLQESRATLRRTRAFADRADPLVRELRPALDAIGPAAQDVRRAAPDLRTFARRLDPLVTAAARGLPAGTDLVEGLRPVLAATGPLLSELNPVLEWLEYNQRMTIGVFSNAAAGLGDTSDAVESDARGHYLPSFSPVGLESAGIFRERIPQHRGNAYLSPSAYADPRRAQKMILPSWDCANTGRGEFTTRKRGTDDHPSCWVQGFPGWRGGGLARLPHIERADYSKPAGR